MTESALHQLSRLLKDFGDAHFDCGDFDFDDGDDSKIRERIEKYDALSKLVEYRRTAVLNYVESLLARDESGDQKLSHAADSIPPTKVS